MCNKNKTALITGACINTGVAIVEKFAQEGKNVIFTGRSKEKVYAVDGSKIQLPDSRSNFESFGEMFSKDNPEKRCPAVHRCPAC